MDLKSLEEHSTQGSQGLCWNRRCILHLFSLNPCIFKTSCSVLSCPMPPPILIKMFLEGRRPGDLDKIQY